MSFFSGTYNDEQLMTGLTQYSSAEMRLIFFVIVPTTLHANVYLIKRKKKKTNNKNKQANNNKDDALKNMTNNRMSVFLSSFKRASKSEYLNGQGRQIQVGKNFPYYCIESTTEVKYLPAL